MLEKFEPIFLSNVRVKLGNNITYVAREFCLKFRLIFNNIII